MQIQQTNQGLHFDEYSTYEEDIDPNDSVTIFESQTSAFCKDIDFGLTTIKGYIANDGTIGAVEIVVQNLSLIHI